VTCALKTSAHGTAAWSAREPPLVDHAALAQEAVASRVARSRAERRLLVPEHMKMLCVLVCSMFACAAPNSDDPVVDTATDGQAAVDGGEPEAVARWNGGSEDDGGEVIVVEGEYDYDPNWNHWHNPGLNQPSEPTGGGGGGGGRPRPPRHPRPPRPSGPRGDAESYDKDTIPKGEDCSVYESFDECERCCDRNGTNVWEPHCRKIPKKKWVEREACWWTVHNLVHPGCVAQCVPLKAKDPGILAIPVLP